jgi:hypothetical protein
MLAAVGISLASMFAVSAPAAAAASTAGVGACTGSGAIYVTKTSQYNWSLRAQGSCPALVVLSPGSAEETQTVSLTGAGTSSTLGFCDKSLLVQNLTLNVTVTFTGTVTGKVHVQHQVWSLPLTLYPLVTPVLVSGDALGVSVLASHYFLNCGNTGTMPSLQVTWVQTIPDFNQ